MRGFRFALPLFIAVLGTFVALGLVFTFTRRAVGTPNAPAPKEEVTG